MKGLTFVLCSLLLLGACTKKKDTDTIIVKMEQPKAPAGVKKQQNFESSYQAQWSGKNYTIKVQRMCDTSLPQISDDKGQKYYDNKFKLTITREDASVFCEHTFSKADFVNHCKSDIGRKGSMLGLVFDRVEPNALVFAVSLGSPDQMSDEFEPFKLTISRFDEVKIEFDSNPDSGGESLEGNSSDSYYDDGV